MREYRLETPVPVDWLNGRDSAAFAWKSLKAGTLLDASPIVLEDAMTGLAGFVKVRVDGHDGLVRRDRLLDALPGWAR